MSIKSNWSKSSVWAVAIASAVLLFTTFNLARWKNHNVVIHDIQSYYSYLPALFIYEDLSFNYKFEEGMDPIVVQNTWAMVTPEGKPVQKMSGGLSILYSPFFFISHGIAKITNYAPNGYSRPYQMGLGLSSVFYAILGMLLMRKTLLRFFSEGAVALTVFSIYIGTNLFYYTVAEGAMSHNYSVFLISLLAFLVTQRLKKQQFLFSILVGTLIGLITIVRPINAIIALFPALYWVLNKEKEVGKNWKHWIGVIIGGLLGIAPQLIYWKYATGDWIYYSYNDEGFFFSDPALLKGLFGFRKGWLIYTPLMVLAWIGFIPLFKESKKLVASIVPVLALYIFVVFSWWCWWYGGSFGMRAMIDCYTLLAFPLAALAHWSLKQETRLKRFMVPTLMLLFLGLNQWQTFQYRKGIIHYDSMTAQAYQAAFLKAKYPKNYMQLIEAPDYEAAKKGEGR